ncbi:MAG: iron chelate uptake ABC transporter family permease subunit [Candidatus Flexifilum sp.]
MAAIDARHAPAVGQAAGRSKAIAPAIPLRWALLIAGLIVLFMTSLLVGPVAIPLPDALTILLGGEAARDSWRTILLQFRLPKALTALLAGAALSVSGLLMQTLFRNPLADPFTLGVSAGGSLGAALVVLLAGTSGAGLLTGLGLLGDAGVIVAASLGAGTVCAAVLLAARRLRSVMMLLIIGLMVGYAAGALVSILVHFSAAERIRAYVNWSFGSFVGVTWSQMPIFAAAVVTGTILSAALIRPLNALLLGESYASSMGIAVGRARAGIIAGTSILAGAVTAFCGPIGFIGIAVPHLARALLRTSDHRVLIPASILIGGMLALAADLAAQLPGGGVILPLNAVTALLGAPVVIAVILRRRS